MFLIIHRKYCFVLKVFYFYLVKVRSNFLRSHAKTGPFLPPSRLIARDGDIGQGDTDAPSESKLLKKSLKQNIPFKNLM